MFFALISVDRPVVEQNSMVNPSVYHTPGNPRSNLKGSSFIFVDNFIAIIIYLNIYKQEDSNAGNHSENHMRNP